ncbi:MAG TPA: amidohydrolase family protein [Pirellulales bacterium]|jgi:L-fuconolactonase|nr:amidohydrolase family protein [Pirellulales bacterium]
MIDAHHHFWRLDQPAPFNYEWLKAPQNAAIRRDYLPEHLQPHLQAAGVERSILVQTQHNLAENPWALELADRHDFIAGVVGWVDLASEGCEAELLQFKNHPKFVGVRHVVQDEPDDGFIVRPDVLGGLKVLERHGVPFDLLFYVKHLRHVPTLVQQLPDLPMVIDHLSKPHIKDKRLDDWLPHFRAAAKFPNVYCKLSGMVTEADWQHWTADDLKPYVQTALELFGPDRLLFGSDWPVCELAGTYERVFEALSEALGPISPDERQAIFGATAQRFYRLPG